MTEPAPEHRVRLGIIGCGVIGQRHIAAAVRSATATVSAICDIDATVARTAAQKFNIDTWCTDARQVINDPRVEAVVLALPAGVRHPIALAALAADKHVLIEKPAGLNATQVRELLTAQGNLVAGCCSSRMRHLPSAQVATEYIASGALGELRMLRIRGITPAPARPTTPPPPWRLSTTLNGGGVLANWGCYDLDYILGITGWTIKPQTILATTWPIAPDLRPWVAADSDAETHVAALIRCSNGAALTLDRGEYLPTHRDAAWELLGTRGSLRLTMPPADSKIIRLEECDERGVTSRLLWHGDENYTMVDDALISDFATAICTGGAPLTSLAQARIIHEILDAIYESARSATAVTLRVPG